MAINYSSFLLLSTVLPLFLFAGCSLEKVKAYRFEEMRANHFQTHVVSLDSLMPTDVCSTPAKGSEISSKLLQVAHKYGPCSPLKERKSKFPSVRQILIDDQIRVRSIHSKISNKDQSPIAGSTAKIPTLETSNYVVRVGFGTPEQNFTVIFDTGSDLTWIQCLPCAGQCYSQQDPYFNTSASSTYSNISCGSNTCSLLKTYSVSPCSTNCLYEVQYGDGSYSQGYFSTDTLTLSPSEAFPNFEFGCGQNNHGLFSSSVDGLLGLGREQISVVSQTSQMYGKLFSYCFPSTTSSTGFLAFGSQAGASSNAQYTPLLADSNSPSFYFLNLMGISVGGQSLSIPESVFTTSGTIIDSGTVITRLAPTAYSALRSAFRQAMSKYPTAPPYSLLDTCYDFSGNNTVEIPTIVLHLGGGTDLNVDPFGILFAISSTQYCLAFAGNKANTDIEILGSTQQKTFEVVYNVVGEKLGFGAGACS